MKLKSWIKAERKTQELFADELGINRVTLNRIVNGADPKPSTARLIVIATNEQVTFNDLYS